MKESKVWRLTCQPFSKFTGTNKAEGVVVKPMRNIVARNENDEKERVIVKVLLPEFVERHLSARRKVTKKGNWN